MRLLIEYDGEPYAGWQRQAHQPSVQQTLEEFIVLVAGPNVRCSALTVAGRTDSGVHASGQVASFFTDAKFAAVRWAPALNTKLPPTIRVVTSAEAAPTFNPRRDAVSKRYEYHVWTRSSGNATDRKTLHWPVEVQWDQVADAARLFVGHHDFKAFQAADAVTKTSNREIFRFEVRHEPPWRVVFDIEGNGFLKQMVRIIVGTLLEVGVGKKSVDEVHAAILSRDRRRAGRTASPRGLWLREVRYRDA